MLLIDGHNLIAKLPHITLGEQDDEAKLMRLLANYHAVRPHEPILVVFDPARERRGGWSAPPGETQAVRSFFAGRGENADDVIARVVQQARSPRAITVVSSDNAVQRAVRRHGAKTMPSEEFAVALQNAFRSPKQKPEPPPPPEEREKPQESDVAYWLRFFKEPPPAPPKLPVVRPRRGARKPAPAPEESPDPEKPSVAGDVDEWLRLFGEPRADRDERHLPPPDAPARPPGKRGPDAKPADEVDSVEYWLREMSKKRDRDERGGGS